MDETSRREEHYSDEHAASLRPNYMGVFWWLLILTILEMFAGSISVSPAYPQAAKAFLLVAMALGKAALVAMYFMHLKFETRILGAIAVTPLVLCVFLLFMLMPDLTWRF